MLLVRLAILFDPETDTMMFTGGKLFKRHSSPVSNFCFNHGVMSRRIDPSWGGPIELFLVPASAPQLV